MAAMTDNTIPAFSFPAVEGKKVTAAFDGGRITSDGGVMLLAMAERRLGVAERPARCIPDRRDLSRIVHTLTDMIRARVFAIACGYEDADDLDVKGLLSTLRLANGDLLDIAHGMHDRDGLFSGDNPHVELPKDFGSFRREARKLALQRL
jgi:hypothetical protein